MDMSPISSSPSETGAFASPCSVSLKINATSVMLYRNIYLKGTGDQRGLSAQEYLCSFSIHETDIPLEFQEQLRRATTGQPQRHEELVQTIHHRALVPARQRRQAKELLEQRSRIKGWVCFAHLQIKEAAGCAHRDSHLADPEIQHGVRQVLQEAQRLLVWPKAVAAQAQAAPDSTRSEQRLRQLLETINDACAQVQAMVPLSGGQFGRGHKFEPSTVEQVQQMWLNTSDAVAALSQRQQFKRPKNWSNMRSADAAAAPESAGDDASGAMHTHPVAAPVISAG